jgi:CDP-glycerol glycerophosphotransferase
VLNTTRRVSGALAGTVSHVSSFTFAKGNAEKVLVLPVYALGALASRIVPRQRDHWVFGCGSGVGEGALALFLEARRANPNLTLTWLARNPRDDADAHRLGIPTVRLTSWRGFWRTLRAEVLVVTHGFGDVNRFGTRGGFIVQLWHGIPLKLIHLDSPATMRSPILPNSRVVTTVLRTLYRGAARGIRMFPAASDTAATRLRTAFALPANRVVVTGDPRDDVLSQGTPDDRATTARDLLARRLDIPPVSSRTRILMHAPTWRDGAVDPVIPTPHEWDAISDYLARADAILVLRPHPLSVGDYGAGPLASDRIMLLDSAMQPDITPVLPAVDTLITDFSSVAYDYALTGGEILYLAPDVESYSTSRGLYEPYAQFSGGHEVATWHDLLALLERRDSDDAWRATLRAHTDAVVATHHTFRDGNNTVRVYTEIVSRLKGTE